MKVFNCTVFLSNAESTVYSPRGHCNADTVIGLEKLVGRGLVTMTGRTDSLRETFSERAEINQRGRKNEEYLQVLNVVFSH